MCIIYFSLPELKVTVSYSYLVVSFIIMIPFFMTNLYMLEKIQTILQI